jgi:hypothetical protein
MKIESIPFEIAHCSSFDPNYEPDQLIDSSLGGQSLVDQHVQLISRRGWQTRK